MTRVVRPGGRVVVLEITTPDPPAAVDLPGAVVRPHRPRPGQAGRRSRRLHLSAQLGAPLPGSRGAGRDHVALRPARHPLRADRRRHHRAARWRGAGSRVSAVPGRAGGRDGRSGGHRGRRCPRPRLLERLEARMAQLAAGHGEPLAGYAADTLSRRRQAAAAVARVPGRRGPAARDRGAAARRGRGRARAQRHPGPRRRARRRRAAPRTADRGRRRRPRGWPPPPATCCSHAPSPSSRRRRARWPPSARCRGPARSWPPAS